MEFQTFSWKPVAHEPSGQKLALPQSPQLLPAWGLGFSSFCIFSLCFCFHQIWVRPLPCIITKWLTDVVEFWLMWLLLLKMTTQTFFPLLMLLLLVFVYACKHSGSNCGKSAQLSVWPLAMFFDILIVCKITKFYKCSTNVMVFFIDENSLASSHLLSFPLGSEGEV